VAKRRESVRQRWETDYAPFVAACRRELAFLVDEHGFASAEVRIEPPSAVITFARGAAHVQIQSEWHGAPWIVVTPIGGPAFGIAQRSRSRPPPTRSNVLTPAEMDSHVAHWARVLSRNAGRWLG
jgi:hypothetical protein